MPEQKGIYGIIPVTVHNHSNSAQGGHISKTGLDDSIIKSGFRVYRALTQSILAATETIILFSDITYDPLSMFNTSTYKFTCPYAGMWKLSVYLTTDAVTANCQFTIRFIDESATIISQCWRPLITATGINSVSFEDTPQLNVGDTVRVQVLCGSNRTLQGGFDRTFFTARWYL